MLNRKCGNGHDIFKVIVCLRRQRRIMEIFRIAGIMLRLKLKLLDYEVGELTIKE
jgi:hypothetical protein